MKKLTIILIFVFVALSLMAQKKYISVECFDEEVITFSCGNCNHISSNSFQSKGVKILNLTKKPQYVLEPVVAEYSSGVVTLRGSQNTFASFEISQSAYTKVQVFELIKGCGGADCLDCDGRNEIQEVISSDSSITVIRNGDDFDLSQTHFGITDDGAGTYTQDLPGATDYTFVPDCGHVYVNKPLDDCPIPPPSGALPTDVSSVHCKNRTVEISYNDCVLYYSSDGINWLLEKVEIKECGPYNLANLGVTDPSDPVHVQAVLQNNTLFSGTYPCPTGVLGYYCTTAPTSEIKDISLLSNGNIFQVNDGTMLSLPATYNFYENGVLVATQNITTGSGGSYIASPPLSATVTGIEIVTLGEGVNTGFLYGCYKYEIGYKAEWVEMIDSPVEAIYSWNDLTDIPPGFQDGVDNVDDADNIIGNEWNENLTLDGDTLNITDGGGSKKQSLTRYLTQVSGLDTDCIDMSVTGNAVTGWVVKSDVKISQDANNGAECRSDGIFMQGCSDNDCGTIDLVNDAGVVDVFDVVEVMDKIETHRSVNDCGGGTNYVGSGCESFATSPFSGEVTLVSFTWNGSSWVNSPLTWRVRENATDVFSSVIAITSPPTLNSISSDFDVFINGLNSSPLGDDWVMNYNSITVPAIPASPSINDVITVTADFELFKRSNTNMNQSSTYDVVFPTGFSSISCNPFSRGVLKEFEWVITSDCGISQTNHGQNMNDLYMNANGDVVVTINGIEETIGSDVDTDTDTQLTDEQVQDIVGSMFTGNTESGITTTYNDGSGSIDINVTGGGGGDLTITDLGVGASGMTTSADQVITSSEKLSFQNGIHVTGTDGVGLGGVLNKTTYIDMDGFDFSFFQQGSPTRSRIDFFLDPTGANGARNFQRITDGTNSGVYAEINLTKNTTTIGTQDALNTQRLSSSNITHRIEMSNSLNSNQASYLLAPSQFDATQIGTYIKTFQADDDNVLIGQQLTAVAIDPNGVGSDNIEIDFKNPVHLIPVVEFLTTEAVANRLGNVPYQVQGFQEDLGYEIIDCEVCVSGGNGSTNVELFLEGVSVSNNLTITATGTKTCVDLTVTATAVSKYDYVQIQTTGTTGNPLGLTYNLLMQ